MKSIHRFAIALAAVAVAGLSHAAAVTPSFGNFGAADVSNDFGGSGIPTNAVASTAYDNGTGTLFLSATQRYSSPALGNDGNGTFFAAPGGNQEGSTYGHTNLAQWNFSFEADPGENDFTYTLYVDLNPGVGTDLNDYSSFTLNPDTPYDSSNLGFFSTTFDPNAVGEYGFMLTASDANGRPAGSVSILVDVGTPTSNVPEPASLALVGIALAGLGVAARRRKA